MHRGQCSVFFFCVIGLLSRSQQRISLLNSLYYSVAAIDKKLSYALVAKKRRNKIIKYISRLARRKYHHTALHDGRPEFRLPHCDFHIAHPGSNAAAVTQRKSKFTKMGEDLPRQ